MIILLLYLASARLTCNKNRAWSVAKTWAWKTQTEAPHHQRGGGDWSKVSPETIPTLPGVPPVSNTHYVSFKSPLNHIFSCDFKCRKRRPLQNHLLEEHNEIIYLCDYCEDIYKSREELINHKSTIHGGVKYPCPEPDCSFATPSVPELEKHVMVHETQQVL